LFVYFATAEYVPGWGWWPRWRSRQSSYGDRDLYVDLAAEEAALGAEKSGRKIAIEIKSFIGPSPLRELELALGQFGLYRGVLAMVDPERRLYRAVPDDIYVSLFASQFGPLAIRKAG
jgi:hypothetical protein